MKPAILLLALTSIALGQGFLTPPGPPGPTMRSLDEIEPRIPLNQTSAPGDATCVFKITKPGSYMLTGNVKPPAGHHGILVALLLPGVVEVDMKGSTIDGSNAGATASGVSFTTTDDLWQFKMGNGTISNFAGGALLSPSSTGGTIALHDLQIRGGGAGVNTGASLELKDVVISSVTGIPIQMGSGSTLERVTIRTSHAGIPKIIQAGDRCRFTDILISSVMGGSTQTSAFSAGQDARMDNMSLRISDATFTGPILSNTSGFTEVTGLDVQLNNVTAPVVSNSFSFGASQGIIGTTYGGDGRISAHNCTFSSALVTLPSAPGLTNNENIPCNALTGTTSAPTVLRVEADNCTVHVGISVAATGTVSGGVIDVTGSGNTIRANISGGNVGVRLSSGTGNTVEGCSLMALLVPAQAIQISPGVTNSLVRNNTAARLAAGGVLVQNNGGSTNFIAPTITTPAQLNTNTNPSANIVH